MGADSALGMHGLSFVDHKGRPFAGVPGRDAEEAERNTVSSELLLEMNGNGLPASHGVSNLSRESNP